MSVINLNKPIGQTPLQAINDLRDRQPDLKDSKMVYAGRLDPMAEGVLIILTDEDRYQLDDYLGLDKEYQATFLIGITTDTYDTLGLVTESSDSMVDPAVIKNLMVELKGVHQLPFPPYSAYKVKGKPLHWWARQGRLDEIKIPLKEMKVINVSQPTIDYRSSKDLLSTIENRIKLVQGDFRQELIVDRWRQVLKDDREYLTASMTLKVGSGTYVRSLAHKLGATLLHLKRIRVGDFKL